MATYSYDDLGRRTGLVLGDGTSAAYAYDAVSRLASHAVNLAGSASDVTATFTYNPAGQIASRTRSNPAYANPAFNRADSYTANGLNQLTAAAGATLTHDARGNVTGVGATSYAYTSENLLKSASTGASLGYDALGRLVEYNNSVSRRFIYDGGQIAAEVNNPSGAITWRYVSGPGTDETLVEYEGSGTANRRFLHADERGSIIALTNTDGTAAAINTYDDYGVPGTGNVGRFGYTGQAWLSEIGLSYYKARMYAPTLGRFMQTDPIGYADGINWYAYVGNDPVNGRDPSGLTECPTSVPGGDVVVCGEKAKPEPNNYVSPIFNGFDTSGPSRPGLLNPSLLNDLLATFVAPEIDSKQKGRSPRNNQRTLDQCPESSFGTFRSAANSAYADNPASLLTSMFPFSVIRGMRIHAQFAGTLNLIGGLYSAEVSYKNGAVVPYGTAGSVRADGVYGPEGSPSYVVELKSGIAFPTPSEIENYRRNLPPGTGVCAIIEAPGAG